MRPPPPVPVLLTCPAPALPTTPTPPLLFFLTQSILLEVRDVEPAEYCDKKFAYPPGRHGMPVQYLHDSPTKDVAGWGDVDTFDSDPPDLASLRSAPRSTLMSCVASLYVLAGPAPVNGPVAPWDHRLNP